MLPALLSLTNRPRHRDSPQQSNEEWRDARDGFDYLAAYRALGDERPPTWHLAGANDTVRTHLEGLAFPGGSVRMPSVGCLLILSDPF